MNWESFDWSQLLWLGGIVLLIFFMMRGCGGCGMGGRRHSAEKDQNEAPSPHSPEKKP